MDLPYLNKGLLLETLLKSAGNYNSFSYFISKVSNVCTKIITITTTITIQCLMWSLHLAMVSMRPADMVSKICGNAPASLQVSHNENKK